MSGHFLDCIETYDKFPVNSKKYFWIQPAFQFCKVEIYNIKGDRVKSFGKTEFEKYFQFDISTLEKGYYFIKLINDKKEYKKKFLKI